MNTIASTQKRARVGYSAPKDDPAISLRLDRTEPPVPYRSAIATEATINIARYPSAGKLEEILASEWGLAANQVMLTAGADEALDRACRAFLNSDSEVITTTPTFEMISIYASLTGARMLEIEWMEGSFDADSISKVTTNSTRLIILVSPNNPTGLTISTETLASIACSRPTIACVIDLAYIEFAKCDPTLDLLQIPNIILIKSFSKAWGLPGLRLGYAMGNAELITEMRSAGGPYSVASASREILTNNLHTFKLEMRQYVARIQDERERLEAWLRMRDLRFLQSEANFVLLFPPDVAHFDRTLRAYNVSTRAFSSNPELIGARRITLPGDQRAFEQLLCALGEML